MQTIQKDTHLLISSDENSTQEFNTNFSKSIDNVKEHHLVLDLTSLSPNLDDILVFLDIANSSRENSKSFVIVCSGINIDDIPDEINVVPTLHEAQDVLEIDAIERDLMGF